MAMTTDHVIFFYGVWIGLGVLGGFVLRHYYGFLRFLEERSRPYNLIIPHQQIDYPDDNEDTTGFWYGILDD